jgi:hypothetical protein
VQGLSSFGNGDQAIDILGRSFKTFAKCTLKSLNDQADFDSGAPDSRRG